MEIFVNFFDENNFVFHLSCFIKSLSATNVVYCINAISN